MTTFKFDLESFSIKCRDSFLKDKSDKSNALWSPIPDVINCTSGKIIIQRYIKDHLTSEFHKLYATSEPIISNKLDTIIFEPTISINYETFNKCNTCNAYIHPKRYIKLTTPECKFINKTLSYKGKIVCYCAQILKTSDSYRLHLNSKSHINKLTKYLEYMSLGC